MKRKSSSQPLPEALSTPAIEILKGLLRVRDWERENLPAVHTAAGYWLFVELAGRLDREQRSLKTIYLNSPYSETTLRLLVRQLEKEGWIELLPETHDGRQKWVRPTPKLMSTIQRWCSLVEGILPPSRTAS